MIREHLTVAKTYRPYVPGSEGVYVSVIPDDQTLIILSEWSRKLGCKLTEDDVDELHCTLLYSRQGTHIGALPAVREGELTYTARLDRFEYWAGHDNQGYLVAALYSETLSRLNKALVKQIGEHSFEDFVPHVTLAKGLRATQDLYNRMRVLSARDTGSILVFKNLSLEGMKD